VARQAPSAADGVTDADPSMEQERERG
jgi:hypothetical protein